MLPWVSCTAIFASSTSIWMNCSSSAKFGWIILSATYFSNPAIPAAFARWISAIPPTAIWRTSRYGPNWRSATAVLPRCSFRRRTALEHLVAARLDEHAEQAQRALGAPIESAHDLCRDAVRDVDDVARRGVRDQVQPQAGAIGLAVDLVRGLDALLDVRE